MLRTLKVLGVCLCLLVGTAASQEGPAEPAVVKYRTEIAPTGDSGLDAALRAVSQLVQLQEQAHTGAIGLIERARAPTATVSPAPWNPKGTGAGPRA